MQENSISLTMMFEVGGVMMTLQVNPSLCKPSVSLNVMIRALKEQSQEVLLE